MTDVLLISPPFRGLLREPLGLYYLAGVLNSNGISTSLMDFNLELPNTSGFAQYLQHIKPKVIGITSYTFNLSVTKKILDEIKRIRPEALTVLGGVHASALAKETIAENPNLDFIVAGEGEQTFLDLCNKVLEKEETENLRGTVLRKGEQICVNPSRQVMEDLDELPFPDRSLLPFERYPVASVQTSRGCPYKCIFCNINEFYGHRIRFRDAKKVAEECAELVDKLNRKMLYFFGDAFTINTNWTEEFCEEILRRRVKFVWGCQTRVDNVSAPMLKKMKAAGCSEIHYGIDYGDDKVLRTLGKDTSLGDVKDAVKWAKDAELLVGGSFIFNCPGEDEETMENTFKLIQEVAIDAVEVNLLTPFPGTRLWHNPQDYNMKITDYDFDDYTTRKYVMENIIFPRDKFVPTFKRLLKRLNLVTPQATHPEIYDFLERSPKLQPWREKHGKFRRFLKI